MLAILVAAVIAAPPAANVSASPAKKEPTVAVWMAPLPMAYASLPFPGTSMLYAPLGATFDFDDWQLGAEVAAGAGVGGFTNAFTFNAAAGPIVRLSGDDAFRGFFVQPKLIFGYTEPRSNCCIVAFDTLRGGSPLPLTATSHAAFQLGVDVGYQFHLGPVYVSPLLGASAGYCFNCDGVDFQYEGPLLTSNRFGSRGHDHFVYSLNLNLLRLGAVF
jgi:hypothetical protein